MLASVRTGLVLTFLAAVIPTFPAAPQTPAPDVARPTAAPEPQYVTEKGFKSRIFEVKHRDPYLLQDALKALGSGFRGVTFSSNRELGTLTVRDFPENLATIEEALKRLDVPEARQPDVQLRLYVLLGSPFPSTAPPSDDIKDVLASLKSTLAYKGYEQVGTFEQRVKDGSRYVEGNGMAEAPEPATKGDNEPLQIGFKIQSVKVENAASGPSVKLTELTFSMTSKSGRASMRTDLSVRDGEKVVVGTSTMRDRALVLVLSARVIK